MLKATVGIQSIENVYSQHMLTTKSLGMTKFSIKVFDTHTYFLCGYLFLTS